MAYCIFISQVSQGLALWLLLKVLCVLDNRHWNVAISEKQNLLTEMGERKQEGGPPCAPPSPTASTQCCYAGVTQALPTQLLGHLYLNLLAI